MEPQNNDTPITRKWNDPYFDTHFVTKDAIVKCKVSNYTLEFYKWLCGDIIITELNTTQKRKKIKRKKQHKKKKHKKRIF
jgi:hypothetical protein